MILRNVNFVIQKEGQGLFFLGERVKCQINP